MLVLDIGTLHSGHRTLATVRLSVGDDIAVVCHCIALCTAVGAATQFTCMLTTVLRQGLQNIHNVEVSQLFPYYKVSGVGYLAMWGVPQLDLQVGAPHPLIGCVR